MIRSLVYSRYSHLQMLNIANINLVYLYYTNLLIIDNIVIIHQPVKDPRASSMNELINEMTSESFAGLIQNMSMYVPRFFLI